ncbi:Small nuclear ribonucleoprotein Sm D2 [Fusarium oxysporum f. sp. albedinis]|nr:Small nuclear ribonucleoprotein Sm D2 [Fusarium oxysporum f. sp. albedinis]
MVESYTRRARAIVRVLSWPQVVRQCLSFVDANVTSEYSFPLPLRYSFTVRLQWFVWWVVDPRNGVLLIFMFKTQI